MSDPGEEMDMILYSESQILMMVDTATAAPYSSAVLCIIEFERDSLSIRSTLRREIYHEIYGWSLQHISNMYKVGYVDAGALLGSD